jgi:hypothetical protein
MAPDSSLGKEGLIVFIVRNAERFAACSGNSNKKKCLFQQNYTISVKENNLGCWNFTMMQ